MAESDRDTSELVDPKHISPPLFSLPGFFVGFGAKGGTQDSDAGKSPTSPLDFGVFANFGGLFSPRSPAPSSPTFSQRNKWVCDKVGLSVLSIGEGDDGAQSDSFRRDNVVLAPQIRLTVTRPSKLSSELLDPCVKSNSLPKNYAAASMSDAVNIVPHPAGLTTGFKETNFPEEEHNSPRRSSSSPMDIISSQPYACSLSGIEMALSEDYTCIISHGPNPKTTHIFGNCILDRDPKEMGGLGTEEETEKREIGSVPNFSEDSFKQPCLCTGQPQDCQNIHINNSEVSEEKEAENAGVEDSLEISPGSSYNEEFFPMAMPLNP